MKEIILTKKDFLPHDSKSVTALNLKLQKIEEPFEVTFDYHDIKVIPHGLFKNTYLTKITIPNTVTIIQKEAFYATSLRAITLPPSIAIIHEKAFAFNGYLTSIALPKSIQSLGKNIFLGCYNLEEININLKEEIFASTVINGKNFLADYEHKKISFPTEISLDELITNNDTIEKICDKLNNDTIIK